MYTFRHGQEKATPGPGEWVRVDMDYRERAGDLEKCGIKAVVKCPQGHLGSVRLHTINSDGDLHPSFVCPWTGCTFHEMVRLDGWTANP